MLCPSPWPVSTSPAKQVPLFDEWHADPARSQVLWPREKGRGWLARSRMREGQDDGAVLAGSCGSSRPSCWVWRTLW